MVAVRVSRECFAALSGGRGITFVTSSIRYCLACYCAVVLQLNYESITREAFRQFLSFYFCLNSRVIQIEERGKDQSGVSKYNPLRVSIVKFFTFENSIFTINFTGVTNRS